MADTDWASIAAKYGPKVAKWAYQAYSQPAAAIATQQAANTGAAGLSVGGSGAGAQAAGESALGTAGGYGSAGAGAGAGASAYGAGGVGMTAGAWASVLAPLVMTYLAYQAGSGRNDPLERKYQTQGAFRQIADLAQGKEVNPNDTYSNYFLPSKKLPAWMDPNQQGTAEQTPTPGLETVDPRGYSPNELWNWMHEMGSGKYQPHGTGNSGYSDTDIDQMFYNTGLDKEGLQKLVGETIPDWSKIKYGDWTPTSFLQKQADTTAGFNALDPTQQKQFQDQAQQQGQDSSWTSGLKAEDLWQRTQDQAAVEKLMGRSVDPNKDLPDYLTRFNNLAV